VREGRLRLQDRLQLQEAGERQVAADSAARLAQAGLDGVQRLREGVGDGKGIGPDCR
jgi:hypothetical protein